jgi:ubiquinone/menaquinone biosynthesis C-methylase UbiE
LLKRNLQPEFMDNPSLAYDEHARALDGLARLNRISGAARMLWPHVRRVATGGAPGEAPSVSVLDVATGSADVPIGLAMLARRSVRLDLRAYDISPSALDFAAERARRAAVPLTLQQRDVVSRGFTEPDSSIDVVMCSLFLHHLKEDAVIGLLGEMRRVARRLVLISDLRRCSAGLAAAYLASRAMSRSKVVHTDAVRSVQGSFTIDELRALAERAEMPDACLRRCWPFRMLLTWDKKGATRSP